MMGDAERRDAMKYEDLREGMWVRLDDGFTCMDAEVKLVKKSESGFYVDCREGEHYLDGQIGDDDELVGVFPA